jgi:hypothetical protein
MRHRFAAVVALTLAAAAGLAGCGDTASSGGAGKPGSATALAGPEGAGRARIEARWAAVRAGGGAKAAPFIAYRGGDEARRLKAPAKYEGDEVRQVDRTVDRVKKHLDAGAPAFERFEAKAKGSEQWIAWSVTFGGGEKPVKAVYAFVQAGDAWLLGDLD